MVCSTTHHECEFWSQMLVIVLCSLLVGCQASYYLVMSIHFYLNMHLLLRITCSGRKYCHCLVLIACWLPSFIWFGDVYTLLFKHAFFVAHHLFWLCCHCSPGYTQTIATICFGCLLKVWVDQTHQILQSQLPHVLPKISRGWTETLPFPMF